MCNVAPLKLFVLSLAILFVTPLFAQQTASIPKKELKYNLTDDGSKYLKLTLLNQFWLRYNRSNPGTTVNEAPAANTIDMGIRRLRFQLYGQLTDHVFFYTQYGLNNFNFLSQNAGNRKLQAFFHDAVGEYKVDKSHDWLKIGGGLTILSGFSRFTQPSVSTIVTLDVPVFLQATVDQTDEFARRFTTYARGQIGRFDYRIGIADPFPIQTNGATPPAISKDATFTTHGHTQLYEGFFIFNFKDKEPHTTPYMVGTYLGEKKVLNLETGFMYQPRSTWTLNGTDTAYHNMLLASIAAFADMPVGHKKAAISAYAGYFYTDYGPGYIRNNGIMNPANGNTNPSNYNGAGNAYPMFGTGNSVYAQFAYKFTDSLLGNNGTLLPYASVRYSKYDKLSDPFAVYNLGVNWLMNKHAAKITLNYELRPLFNKMSAVNIVKAGNAGSAWLQYQIFL